MDAAEEFIGDMEYEKFVADKKTIYAVVRSMGIIGEAVKNIPEDERKKYPGIPWRPMAGMRDKVIHEYFGISIERVWETVKKDVPGLKPLFKKMLKDYL